MVGCGDTVKMPSGRSEFQLDVRRSAARALAPPFFEPGADADDLEVVDSRLAGIGEHPRDARM